MVSMAEEASIHEELLGTFESARDKHFISAPPIGCNRAQTRPFVKIFRYGVIGSPEDQVAYQDDPTAYQPFRRDLFEIVDCTIVLREPRSKALLDNCTLDDPLCNSLA